MKYKILGIITLVAVAVLVAWRNPAPKINMLKPGTYRNDRYGFEFQVPEGFELRTKPIDNSNSWIEGYIPFPSDGNDSVVAVAVLSEPKTKFPNTDLDEAFFAVRVMEHSSCPKIENLQRRLGEADINGTLFWEAEGGGVALGHQQSLVNYANSEIKGNCYWLQEVINTSGYGAIDGLTPVKQYLVNHELDKVLKTFKFIK